MSMELKARVAELEARLHKLETDRLVEYETIVSYLYRQMPTKEVTKVNRLIEDALKEARYGQDND